VDVGIAGVETGEQYQRSDEGEPPGEGEGEEDSR
jgi:hypothetical protein